MFEFLPNMKSFRQKLTSTISGTKSTNDPRRRGIAGVNSLTGDAWAAGDGVSSFMNFRLGTDLRSFKLLRNLRNTFTQI